MLFKAPILSSIALPTLFPSMTVLISFEEVHDGGIMRDINFLINAVIVFYTNFFLKKSKA